MGATTIATGVAVFIALGTTACLVFVGYLVNDISNFYDETMGEFVEFKVIFEPEFLLSKESVR